MSLITRCPACGTMFKVVPDQLRISEGWVRCGQCAEIFDATSSLQGPEATALPAEAAAAPSMPVAPPLQVAPPPVAPTVAAVAPAPIHWPEFRETVPPPATPAPRFTAPVSSPPTPAAEAPDSIDAPPLYPSFPSEGLDSQLLREVRQQPEEEEEEPDLDSVSFVRRARRQAVWRRPLVRALLLLALLLLAGILVLQYAVQERDKLAALRPSLRPWLQLLCSPLRCQVGPPRQIDAIVIDSSAFQRLRSDAYRLSYSLRNQAAIPVAMPSVELTLTDSQDQPVLRRVLAPGEIATSPVIPAAGEASGSVAVSVAGNGSASRISGYRLLAFYP